MKRLQAFKFELMPDGEQERDMRRFAGARRFVYDKALAIQKTNFEAGGKFISYVDMANRLPEWKEEFPWLKESPSQQTCPACGHVAKENRQTQAKFECVDCGHEENADVVGAMNVLARGHSNAACGEDGSGLACKRKTKPASVKQEPTEATIREVTYA